MSPLDSSTPSSRVDSRERYSQNQKRVFGLVVVPAAFVAIAMFSLYFIAMPLFPVIHKYYFVQSNATYATYHFAIMGHILFGTVALLLGPINLFNALRGKHFNIHRKIGATYAIAVSASAPCAMFMAFHAYAGTIHHGRLIVTSGLFTLACLWLITLYLALYAIIVKRNRNRHFFWMIINVSLTYAAVVFRVENGIILALSKFDTWYPYLGWLSWLPSAIVGPYLANKRYKRITRLGSV